jgi:hypothetical protein
MNFKLSILIPARNEEFLKQTVENLLETKNHYTEILVGLDGQLPVEPLDQHKDVTVVYFVESIGQRAMTNRLCQLSKAKYVMKLDAHCKMDKDFDKKLIEDMQDDWTVVPKMYNLHAFDWVCQSCGVRRYQGKSGKCKCGGEEKKEIIFEAKPSPETTAMKFDTDLRFGYWGQYKKRQKGDLVETMSLLGACWMLTREKYWELNICDEEFGSWGQQGTEVACKTWLSGGKLICNKKTWFAHMFRTQGGDFGFPYGHKKGAITKARQHSRNLFLEGKWKGKYDLNWLINKFNPPDWQGIIYYTDNQLNLKIAHKVQDRLKKMGLPIVSASLKPMNFGENYVIEGKRGNESYFKQILKALEKSKSEIIFFCEHDVLYNPTHFDFIPPKKDKFYFNTNVWKVDWETGKALWTDNLQQVSGMVCYRDFAIEHYERKLKLVQEGKFNRRYEPETKTGLLRVSYQSKEPIYDIRHNNNLTKSRWSKDKFKNKEYTKGWKTKTIKL